jgi:hypothetical protein
VPLEGCRGSVMLEGSPEGVATALLGGPAGGRGAGGGGLQGPGQACRPPVRLRSAGGKTLGHAA